MKFNKTLNESILKEWKFYSVDYKAMKKALKDNGSGMSTEEYFEQYELSKKKLTKFYTDKEKWAVAYYDKMKVSVEELRAMKVTSRPSMADTTTISNSDDSESDNESNCVSDNDNVVFDIDAMNSSASFSDSENEEAPAKTTDHEFLKQEYRRVGRSNHFQKYIYAKKSLDTFARELDLVLEFLFLNQTAFSKILKKFDKRTGSSIRQEKLAELAESHGFLNGEKMKELREGVSSMIDVVSRCKPVLPEGWETRKVYTIGCFDLFHRGHQNALMALREFGYFIVAGIHDDESYFKLKNKYTIDNLEQRMANVKPYVDQLYVIPSTDPTFSLQCMTSEQDIETGSCCYARGDDMLNFPGREWVESVMPVHFIPRTEDCSSSLLRTIYHAEDPEIRKKAAFAQTRYDGKPIDADGNVIKG